jgi:hypothetical protein
VYLTDAAGKFIFPDGAIIYDKVRPDGISERHFVPRTGAFTVSLPPGKYRLTIERGKEYISVEENLSITDQPLDKRIQLQRWVKMADRGWFSGDMHLHRGLADLDTLMQSEDLAAAVPITRWLGNTTLQEDPDLARFLRMPAPKARVFTVLNEELEPHGSALLAFFSAQEATPLEYPLGRFGVKVKRAGGISDSEKATSLELPAIAAVGGVETIGLANNHLWRSGSFTGAWGAWPSRMLSTYPETCTGYVQSGFDMYAALLNSGFEFKLSAGSASGVHPVPPGWSRIYVRTRGPLTMASWLEGVRQGRSFVTTGPMLLLSVNGVEPGDEIRDGPFPLQLRVTVEALSLEPIESVEVVANGEVHRLRLTKSKERQYSGTLALTVASSAWIAARWSAPRGAECDAAHTSPVYLRDGTRPVPIRRQDVQALLERVEKLIADVNAGNPGGAFTLDSETTRQATLDYLESARKIYRSKLAEPAATGRP